ncbi:hypothetical protein OH492_25945 [Vibrio chagasii]|nr:hypothetical protein [Vibrio chagasii]
MVSSRRSTETSATSLIQQAHTYRGIRDRVVEQVSSVSVKLEKIVAQFAILRVAYFVVGCHWLPNFPNKLYVERKRPLSLYADKGVLIL